MNKAKRPIVYLGSTQKDLSKFPKEVREVFALGIYMASIGSTHISAKPLKGFGGRSVVELIEDHRGDTFRAVYTIRFKEAIYVLHAFKKKSKRGIATPKKDRELIEKRLKDALALHKAKRT